MIDSPVATYTEADVKKAEYKGYSKGYQAGKRRRRVDDAAERNRRERQAFLDKALLALLPACINAENWKIGDRLAVNAEQRVRLAVLLADQALKQRRVL